MKRTDNIPKRIFLISNMWPDVDSPGYGSFVKNVAKGLTDNGYSIVRKALIVGRPHGKKGKLRSYLGFYWSLVRGFLLGGYDMIYIHFPNQTIPVLRQLYRIKCPPIVVNYHGEDLLYDKGGYKETLGRQTDSFLMEYATRIVVPSRYFKDIVVERGIANSDRVIVSPSGGISEEVFYPLTGTADQVPESFSAKRPLRLGYVGRLEQEKGIFDFLMAVLNVKEQGVPVKATVVGYGALESKVKEFIKAHRLEETVDFKGGMAQSELGDCYRGMDLFVFPTHAPESLGLTGIEALACGVPVVGSNVGGIATYLTEGENGFLVTPGDIGSLAERIEGYAALHASRRLEMRKRCIESGSRFYSKVVCRELSERFDEVLRKD